MAVLILGALTVVLVTVGGVLDAPTDDPEPDRPISTLAKTAPASSESVPPTRAVATTAVSTTMILSVGPSEVAAAGLEAWGRFGVSGDLGEVEPWFHPEGPQFARFRSEAPDLVTGPVGGPAYSVSFESEESTRSGDEVRIRGEVVFVRTGEPSQRFDWVVVLREERGRWWIWTVEEAEDQSSDE